MTTDFPNIGRYEIKRELGRGGMATVYDAYDPSFGRNVAVKVLPRAFLHDPQFRARFDREARTVALLEHPAIVPVYDFGEANEQPYIVMQLMNGGSLADRLEKGPIPPEEAAKIILRLAQALDVAHTKGIIHRDLKPGNVLFDQYGNAFLSDFGIARLKEAGGGTLTGSQIIGTPAYMSPEQIQGEKNIDGRSDIYALGVILFLMLSNQMPFQADTPAKVMIAHIMEPAPSILIFKEDLPPGIDDILDRALAKDPDDRYQTATEMAEEFNDVVRASIAVTRPRPGATEATMQAKPAGVTSTRLSAPKPGSYGYKAPTPTPTPTLKTEAPPVQPPSRTWLWFVVGGFVLIAIIALSAIVAASLLPKETPSIPAPTSTVEILPTEPPTPTTEPATPTVAPEPATDVPVIVEATPPPEPTETPTEAPTLEPTPTASTLVIGGADKVAFIRERNIWVANLDGSDLRQLTTDGANKFNLQWTPDGQLLFYISGTCIKSVNLEGVANNVACFRFVQVMTGYAVSPDMQKIAISLDNEMYILPFDLARLNPGTDLNRNNVIALANELCEFYAPYERLKVREMLWAKDGNRMAIKIIGVGAGTLQGLNIDSISIIDVSTCTTPRAPTDNFPVNRFNIDNFDDRPEFTDWNWDGEDLYTVTSHSTSRTGWGELYFYNGIRFQGGKLGLFGAPCCFREARFSPDGQYLFFAYQPFAQSSQTQIYYVFYSDITSGVTPIPLPIELPDSREFPQIALRPAVTP